MTKQMYQCKFYRKIVRLLHLHTFPDCLQNRLCMSQAILYTKCHVQYALRPSKYPEPIKGQTAIFYPVFCLHNLITHSNTVITLQPLSKPPIYTNPFIGTSLDQKLTLCYIVEVWPNRRWSNCGRGGSA